MLSNFCSTLLTILLCLQLTFAVDLAAAGFAAGFHLSIDYGVASVYFDNGSSLDIAKIPGGAQYRHVMRSAFIVGNDASVDSLSRHTFVSDRAYRTSQTILRFPSFRDRLPPWLGGRDPRSQALTPMLKALKAATESALEATLLTAEIVLSFPTTQDFRDLLASTAIDTSLKEPMVGESPASLWAASAYDFGRNCEDPPQVVLAVEYTESALIAFLTVEVCTYFEIRREMRSMDLGLGQADGGANSSYVQHLEEALRNLIHLPLDDRDDGEKLEYVSNVALLGESAKSPVLNRALVKVLREQYGLLNDSKDRKTIDPLYAAAAQAALVRWDRVTDRGSCTK